MTVEILFPEPIIARYLRILPYNCQYKCAMKFEVLGVKPCSLGEFVFTYLLCVFTEARNISCLQECSWTVRNRGAVPCGKGMFFCLYLNFPQKIQKINYKFYKIKKKKEIQMKSWCPWFLVRRAHISHFPSLSSLSVRLSRRIHRFFDLSPYL